VQSCWQTNEIIAFHTPACTLYTLSLATGHLPHVYMCMSLSVSACVCVCLSQWHGFLCMLHSLSLKSLRWQLTKLYCCVILPKRGWGYFCHYIIRPPPPPLSVHLLYVRSYKRIFRLQNQFRMRCQGVVVSAVQTEKFL